jgi:hypothetical protein
MALLPFVSQQLARLSIEEVQFDAGWTDYRFVSISERPVLLIILQPVLDEKVGRRTIENELIHSIVVLNYRIMTLCKVDEALLR